MPAANRSIILIAHNLRSCHNVGSLLRTADGLGVQEVILSGYTPYPLQASSSTLHHSMDPEEHDARLPHEARRIDRQIRKTALGAETSIPWRHVADLQPRLLQLITDGWQIAAVEQAQGSVKLPDFSPPPQLVLVVGREVEGIEPEILAQSHVVLEIPMFGSKESFNVVQAAAMAMYHCRFTPGSMV